MSILTSASATSVSRGFDYFSSNDVRSVKQLNDNEFEGYVKGSLKELYFVKINLAHPKKSYCDCPHANGNIICKHMVAMYFTIKTDEAEDYKEWRDSDYEGDAYDEYDDHNHDYQHSTFEKPLSFDDVLNSYIDELSLVDLKTMLKQELLKDEEGTYYAYLAKNYQKYLRKLGAHSIFLDELSERLKEVLSFYDYDYNDFSKIIFSPSDRKEISRLYTDPTCRAQINKLILNPKLADFSNYQSMINFIKEHMSHLELTAYIKDLQNHLSNLKHYSIRNDEPKSNILITIHLLSATSIKDQAQSLLKNAKYISYVEFIIKNSEDYQKLYREFKKQVGINYQKNKQYIPDVFNVFIVASDYRDHSLFYDYSLYGFLCKEDVAFIKILESTSHKTPKTMFIKEVESKTDKVYVLAKLYDHFEEVDKLWNLIFDNDYKHLLIQHIDALKGSYNDELYQYFHEQFYTILKSEKSRDNYRKSCSFIKAIFLLQNGDQLVDSIKSNLRLSEYKKCKALFEEIDNILK